MRRCRRVRRQLHRARGQAHRVARSLPAPPDLDLAAVEPGAYVVMSPEHHGSGTSTFEDSAAWRQWEAGDLMLLPPKGAFVFISDYTIVLIALERLLL